MKECDVYDLMGCVLNDIDSIYYDSVSKINKEFDNQQSVSLSARVVNLISDDMRNKGYICDFSKRMFETVEYEYPNRIKIIDDSNLIFYINKENEFINHNSTTEKTIYLKESFEKIMSKNNVKMKKIEVEIPDGYDYQIDNNDPNNIRIHLEKKDYRPKSWEEYCDDNLCKMYYHANNTNEVFSDTCFRGCYNQFENEDEAYAFIALGKLIQLRDAWVGDWKPDMEHDIEMKYSITIDRNEIISMYSHTVNRILIFPTSEMRDDFLKCFRDLIEEAKMFL